MPAAALGIACRRPQGESNIAASTKTKIEITVLLADLAGTFVFAIEGAIVAMRNNLDLFGVMVVAFVSALGGGVIRDVLIGATPPTAVRDWRYPAVTHGAALIAFSGQTALQLSPSPWIIVLDAAGLALFAVAGVEKAMLYGVGPFAATLMGTMTGVGGGVVRDILLAHVPAVLQADIYATAAFAGALVVVGSRRLGLSPGAAALAGGLLCFALRLLAVHYGWHLPRAATH